MSGTVSWRSGALDTARWAATGVLLPVWAVAAATGALYLLYGHHLLGAGMAVPATLPLEDLAGHGAQPLLRDLVAWLCAGVAAGCLLGALHRPRPGLALAAFAVGAALALVASGAAGRALVRNQPVGPQVASQVGSTATTFAWGVVVCGAGAGAVGIQALAARRAG
jgi:hypothetical protein